MWKIISMLLPWFFAIVIITQIIIPILLKKDIFWILRKKKNTDPVNKTLEDEVIAAQKESSNSEKNVWEVKNKVNEHFEEAERLKRKSDSI